MFRLTVAGLLILVGFLALGFGALKNPSILWACSVFMLANCALVVATIGSLVRRGRSRGFWTGFAVAGWTYWLLSFGPWFSTTALTPPPLITTRWLSLLYPPLNRLENFTTPEMDTPGEVNALTGGDRGREDPRGGLVWGVSLVKQPDGSSLRTYMMPLRYSQIGHALFVMLSGLAGGMVGLIFVARNEADARSAGSATAPRQARDCQIEGSRAV